MSCTKIFQKLVLVYFLFSPFIITAQNTFFKTYGGSENDEGRYIAATSDSGYIITGKSNSTEAGDYDVILIKTDADGEILWEKKYGGSGDDKGNCVQQLSNGNYVVAGQHTNVSNYKEPWVFITDSIGNIIWQQIFAGFKPDDEATYVLPFDNRFFLSYVINNRGYVYLYNNDGGEIQYTTFYGLSEWSRTESICRVGENRCTVAGEVLTQTGIYPINIERFTLTPHWIGDSNGFVRFISSTNDLGFITGGMFNNKPSLIKYDSLFCGYNSFTFNDVDSGYYFVGGVETDKKDFVVIGDWTSGAILKISEVGNLIWYHHDKHDNNNFYYSSIQNTLDNQIVLTGYTETEDNKHQIILVKLTNDGGLDKINDHSYSDSALMILQNAPNPFSDKTTINLVLNSSQTVTLSIKDVSGKTIKMLYNGKLTKNKNSFTWDGNNENGQPCPNGLYFIVAKNDEANIEVKKIIKSSL